MEKLIERYIYAVSSRLPEKEREEVEKELRANIYDMLSEEAEEKDVEDILYTLGEPSILAEKYRQGIGYLISPRLYGDYIHVLKWIVPVVGVILCIVGMVLGAIDTIKDEMVELNRFILGSIGKGISLGIEGVIQALFWTTVGFVIAERSGYREKKEKWKIEDLPEVIKNNRKSIALSDTIAELVILTLASIVFIAFGSGWLSLRIGYLISYDGVQVSQIFTREFWKFCIPLIIFSLICSIGTCILKIRVRKWNGLVSGIAITNNLINLGLTILVFNKKNIFSQEFLSFISKWEGINTVKIMILAIIVVITLIECVVIMFRFLKTRTVI
jgi:hypothetical protein